MLKRQEPLQINADSSGSSVQQVTHFIHQHFLPMLVLAYVLAAVVPQFGLWLRHIEFGQLHWGGGGKVKVTLSLLMLSFLLFNAGLGIKAQELVGIWKRPIVIISGFVANMAVPTLLVLGLRGLMQLWQIPTNCRICW